jgi:DNA-directed RNA polymerase subunit RPC12/RpoP
MPNENLTCTRCKKEVETYSEIVYSQGSKVCTDCKKETLEDDQRAFDRDMSARCR